MLYDILLLDNTVCIRETHDERRRLLQALIHCTPGRIDIETRQIIDFSAFDAPERINKIFARAITQRWERVYVENLR
jgi:DNA ligase-4